MEEPPQNGWNASRYFNVFMVALIILNVTVVILETVHTLYLQFFWEFTVIDVVSIIFFTVEYILRLWVCTERKEFHNPITGRIRYAGTPLALVDLLAILPFYLPMFIPIDLRFLRILRLFRIIRILKLGRYSDVVHTFYRIVVRKKEELLLALSLLFIAIIMASALMYDAEHVAQPEAFASIPHSMWWAITTLATVGYGDVYPVTAVGKLIGGIVVIIGIGIFALPTAIFASGFVEEIQKKKKIICPKCGHEISNNSSDSPKIPDNGDDKSP